ncbi:hypothetical protein Tco_1300182, partial [Tanacetum coccineum]
VMATFVIPISSDSSEESVGSHVSRVILFGTIPTSIHVIPVVLAEVPIAPVDQLVAPEVGAVSIISPTEVLDLVDYSSSFDSDPSQDSLPLAPELPLVSPFLCSDDSKADSESEPAEQRPEIHESLTLSSEFPLALVVAPPRIRQRPANLVRPSEAIPFGRPYLTHPNLPRRLLTVRKRVGPFPAHSSSSSSSLDSSSDTSSSSSSDSLSTHRQFIRQDAIHHLASTHVDLLPPRKRFRDLYSSKDSGEEHTEIGTADVEAVADLGVSDGVRAHIEDGIGMGVEVATSDIKEDEKEFEAEASVGGTMEIAVDPLVNGGIFKPTRGDAPDLEGSLYDIAHYKSEVPLDRITEFETAQRQLEASGERVGLADREEFCQIRRDLDDTWRKLRRLESLVERTMTNTRSGITPAAIEEMINRRVAEALETCKANRNIGLGNNNGKGGNANGDGNGNGGGNRNGNHNEIDRDARPIV